MRSGVAPRVGYIVHGGRGVHPGSAHIRVVRRLADAARRGEVIARQLDVDDVLRGIETARFDSIVVQRDSLGARDAERVVRRLRTIARRVVFDVDDDFFTERAIERLTAQGYDRAAIVTMHELARLADATTVSTKPLAALVESVGGRAVVAANALDPGIWLDDLASAPRRLASPPRLLYMGSVTHEQDLLLLRDVMRRLSSGPRPVALDVVGVTRGSGDWFDRVEIDGGGNYPGFVRWLRARAGTWTAGVAPLADDGFNEMKSDVKFLEYTLLGLPTIASRSTPYAEIERHGGRLAGDDESWANAIGEMLDPTVRRASIGRARRYVRGERMTASGDAWITAVIG